jgi:hypothetical protein
MTQICWICRGEHYIKRQCCDVQGDSLTRGPTEVYLQIFNEFVNKLTDDELTTGYYQQDSATCYTSNASMREIESFFKDRIISKNVWPPRSPDFFLWGLLKSKVYKNTPRTIEELKDAIRKEIEAVNVDTLGMWYIFVNCNWVVTRWQKYSTHLRTNNTLNDTKQTIHRTT